MMNLDKLTPEGKRFLKELEELAKLEVAVGYLAGEATDEKGVDLCDIAMWNELGTQGEHPIPSRPFLRQTIDNNEGKIKSFCQAQAVQISQGGSAEDCLKRVGVYMKGLVQQTILDGDFVPNAPSTIKRKGSDRPLIDTGQLRQSVNYHIRPKRK